MLNLIEQIIDIDKNAQARVSDADAEAKGILGDAEKKILELKKEFEERADKRLIKVNEAYSGFADEEIAKIIKKRDENIAAIKKVMNENKERYEREILNRITGSTVV